MYDSYTDPETMKTGMYDHDQNAQRWAMAKKMVDDPMEIFGAMEQLKQMEQDKFCEETLPALIQQFRRGCVWPHLLCLY